MKKTMRRAAKAFAGLLAVSVLGTTAPGFSASAAGVAGDANSDGTFAVNDLVTVQKHLLGNKGLSRDGAANADVTGDGVVNGFDLALMRTMLAADPVSDSIIIHLSDAGITVEGDTKGVTSVSGKTVTVTASGKYTVDGSITDGQILVNVPDPTADAEDVEFTLENVTMTSSTGAPCLYAQSAAKVKINANGTNTLTDTAAAANAETSGVIFADCDLTVTKNSTGTLNITSSMNTAIRSKDDIKLNGGTIVINTDVDSTSDADAIQANNTLTVGGANVQIESSADGLKSSKEDVVISSGSVFVKAGNDAVQAATALTISGGDVTACGDRGFTLDAGGALNITGGNVLATATDYAFGVDETGADLGLNLSGSTQGVMQLAYAAEWKKGNAVTVQKDGSTVYEASPIKKFDYVLASGSGLTGAGTYNVYTGGTQMTHDASTTGEFTTTGVTSSFTGVAALEGGQTVEPSTDDTVATKLTYADNTVTAYNAAGAAIASPANVTLSGATATVITPAAAEIEVDGTSFNGQLVVNIDKTTYAAATLTLSLNGLTLSNSSVAPIYVESIDDEVSISVKNGSVNTISDGTTHTDTYVNSDGETKTVSAAIFARDDLEIKGKGTLVVNGNFEDGIKTVNDLQVWNGTIQVTALKDALRGNDSVTIGKNGDDSNYATLNVTAVSTTDGDAIKSSSTDSGKGYIEINGGTLTVKTGEKATNSSEFTADAIQAEQSVTVNGGDLNIYTYQGSGFGSTGSSSGQWGGGGMGMDGNSAKSEVSAKGIKAVGLYDSTGTTWQSGGDITINGGTFKFDTSDDALHCGGSMTVNGGVFEIASADDALHSDHDLTIGAGSANTFDDVILNITKCYEGVEGVTINQNSGTVYVVSGDDGYNAAGGADGSGNQSGNPWGGGMMSTSTGTLNFNGGCVCLNSANGDHDALDSNGPINLNGGYLVSNGQEPIDADGTISYNGTSLMTMTAGNTNLGTRYSFVNSANQVIVSFLSASGSPGQNCTNCTAWQGGSISGGTELIGSSVIVGGTLSGATQVTATSSGGSMQPGGPGGR